MTIKIVRFKDGLDVITNLYYGLGMDDRPNGDVELTNPMMFEVRNSNLVMQHWLPLSIMKGEKVTIRKEEILCTFEPNDEFAEYYDNTVREMRKAVRESEKDPEMSDMLEALAEINSTKGLVIH